MKIISGGAVGADTVFATQALKRDIDVDIHSFLGHKTNSSSIRVLSNIIIHSKEDLDNALPYIKQANKVLKRKIPSPGYVRNLLCRNYYQINKTDCVIAVGRLDMPNNTVKGGTGWAVQMALDKYIPVFLFDMNANVWLSSFGLNKIMGVWHSPFLKEYNNITGIGSRELTPKGAQEIKKLFEVI